MDMKILTKPSLTLRVGIGKLVGLLIGLLGFFLLPLFYADVDWPFRWGVLFWYATVGAIIGIFGVYTRHPVLNLPFSWWFRSSIIGIWMNLVLGLFIYEKLQAATSGFFGTPMGVLNPFLLFLIEGAIVGLIIGWIATHFGGEGPETASH